MLVKVLPLPVAIWTRALGFLAVRLFSRFSMAVNTRPTIWTWRRLCPIRRQAGHLLQAGEKCGRRPIRRLMLLHYVGRACRGDCMQSDSLGLAALNQCTSNSGREKAKTPRREALGQADW